MHTYAANRLWSIQQENPCKRKTRTYIDRAKIARHTQRVVRQTSSGTCFGSIYSPANTAAAPDIAAALLTASACSAKPTPSTRLRKMDAYASTPLAHVALRPKDHALLGRGGFRRVGDLVGVPVATAAASMNVLTSGWSSTTMESERASTGE